MVVVGESPPEIIISPQGEAALDIPTYVGVLASDVVNGNPANTDFQGHPLGNLLDQPAALRATVLTTLIGKWFDGADVTATATGHSYSVVAGSLYGDSANPAQNVPSIGDMEQGQVADCYLIAAVGSLAESNPMAIVMALMLALFTMPSLPSYQGPHAAPLALMGFAVSAVLLVCLWRNFKEEP